VGYVFEMKWGREGTEDEKVREEKCLDEFHDGNG
jgi:hypothetical protein